LQQGRRERKAKMDMLMTVPVGLLSGLEVQSEISELLDELYYLSLR
jgi:hypothetical protein